MTKLVKTPACDSQAGTALIQQSVLQVSCVPHATVIFLSCTEKQNSKTFSKVRVKMLLTATCQTFD